MIKKYLKKISKKTMSMEIVDIGMKGIDAKPL
jgi:hypothetical protein